jgi:hypothetical protein
VFASERSDTRRHFDAAAALIAYVCGDANHGIANRKIIGEWIRKWTEKTERASHALKGIFDVDGVAAEPFDQCFQRVHARQRTALNRLGF